MRLSFCHGLPTLQTQNLTFCQTKFFNHFKGMMSMNANNGKLKYMGESYYHDSVMVTMNGFYIEVVKIKNLFTTIDFSNNSFKQEIPKSIGKLNSLKGLNFSHHNLYRSYASIIGKFEQS